MSSCKPSLRGAREPGGKTPERRQLEMRAAAAMELRRRNQREKTVYGFYRPTDVFGGELIRCLQEQDGRYVEGRQAADRTPAGKA